MNSENPPEGYVTNDQILAKEYFSQVRGAVASPDLEVRVLEALKGKKKRFIELLRELNCPRSSLKFALDSLVEDEFVERKKISHKRVYYSLSPEMKERYPLDDLSYIIMTFSQAINQNPNGPLGKSELVWKVVTAFVLDLRLKLLTKPEGVLEEKLTKFYFTQDLPIKLMNLHSALSKSSFDRHTLRNRVYRSHKRVMQELLQEMKRATQEHPQEMASP